MFWYLLTLVADNFGFVLVWLVMSKRAATRSQSRSGGRKEVKKEPEVPDQETMPTTRAKSRRLSTASPPTPAGMLKRSATRRRSQSREEKKVKRKADEDTTPTNTKRRLSNTSAPASAAMLKHTVSPSRAQKGGRKGAKKKAKISLKAAPTEYAKSRKLAAAKASSTTSSSSSKRVNSRVDKFPVDYESLRALCKLSLAVLFAGQHFRN